MEWIDINTKLPPNNTSCIVWVKKHGYYDSDFFSEVIFNAEFARITDNRFVLYENGGEYEHDYTAGVTHWMIPTKPSVG